VAWSSNVGDQPSSAGVKIFFFSGTIILPLLNEVAVVDGVTDADDPNDVTLGDGDAVNPVPAVHPPAMDDGVENENEKDDDEGPDDDDDDVVVEVVGRGGLDTGALAFELAIAEALEIFTHLY
jgi:hypothetical protein